MVKFYCPWLRDRVNSETGHSAFELTFGSEDVRYFRLSEGLSEPERCSRWLVNLNEKFQAIREICRKHQEGLIMTRKAGNPEPARENQYVRGDLVLYNCLYNGRFRRTKLSNRYKRPYEVIQHVKNDFGCRNLNLKSIESFVVDRLTIFSGTRVVARGGTAV